MTDDLSADDAKLIRAGRRALRELPDAPEWRVLQAEALGRATRPRSASPMTRLIAVLGFDSWTAPAPALRGASAPGTRQLMYAAARQDVALRLVPAGGAWSLEGQILGPDASGEVELERGQIQPSRFARLDEFGTFRFDGIAPGTVRLVLHLESMQVELPELWLGDVEPEG